MLVICLDHIKVKVLNKEKNKKQCLIHCKEESYVCSEYIYNKICLGQTYLFCIKDMINNDNIFLYKDILSYKDIIYK